MGTKILVSSLVFGSLFVALSVLMLLYETKLVNYLVSQVKILIQKRKENLVKIICLECSNDSYK